MLACGIIVAGVQILMCWKGQPIGIIGAGAQILTREKCRLEEELRQGYKWSHGPHRRIYVTGVQILPLNCIYWRKNCSRGPNSMCQMPALNNCSRVSNSYLLQILVLSKTGICSIHWRRICNWGPNLYVKNVHLE
jgi:hypothetical protein